MAGTKGQHSAKGTKQHSIMRSAKNKRTGKYERQRYRTDGRKERVRAGDTAALRRISQRRKADAADTSGIAGRKRERKRETRKRLRNYSAKDRARARERGQRQFAKKGGEA